MWLRIIPEIAGVKVPSPMTTEVPRMVMVKRAILAALLDSSFSLSHCALRSRELGASTL
jgi:hypothetical protein